MDWNSLIENELNKINTSYTRVLLLGQERDKWKAVAEYRQDLIKELEDEIARLGGAK